MDIHASPGSAVAVKTILLLVSFLFFSAGALYAPMIGVVGYVLHYHIWPDNQWWGRELSEWGLRYAFTIGLCLLIGTLLNKSRLRIVGKSMVASEWLMLAFWAAAMLTLLTGWSTASIMQQYEPQMILIDKISKVLLFCLLMSHVVTTMKRFNILIWTMIAGTLYVGYQAWQAPVWNFMHDRLNNIGGPDFRESSFLGAHFAIILPIIGMQFLRSGWRGKLVCAIAGAFAVNGLILTRTRAAFLALGVGIIVAMLFSIRGKRATIFLYLAPGLLAAAYLTDTGFRDRMTTITSAPSPEDQSAYNRLIIWQAAGQMFIEHPMGVGVGNFGAYIGKYAPGMPNRDTHNTFIRCATEIGLPGIVALLGIITAAFLSLRRSAQYAWHCADDLPIRCCSYGLGVALCVLLVNGMFMSQVYIEEFWWMLTLPTCLLRSTEHEYAYAMKEAYDDLPNVYEEGLDGAVPAWGDQSLWIPPRLGFA